MVHKDIPNGGSIHFKHPYPRCIGDGFKVQESKYFLAGSPQSRLLGTSRIVDTERSLEEVIQSVVSSGGRGDPLGAIAHWNLHSDRVTVINAIYVPVVVDHQCRIF